MNSDKNTLIGFVILGALLIGYIFYNQKSEEAYRKAKKAKEDSIALVQQKVADSLGVSAGAKTDSLQATDSLAAVKNKVATGTDTLLQSSGAEKYGVFGAASSAPEKTVAVDNGLFKIIFTTKGARPRQVVLHDFKSYDDSTLKLVSGPYNDLNLQFLTTNQKLINTSDLNFDLVSNKRLPDSTRQLQYRLYAGSKDRYLQYTYLIHPDQYMLNFDIQAVGLQGLIAPSNGALKLHWNVQADQQEKDAEIEKRYTQVYYGVNNDELDYWTLERHPDKNLDQKIQWLSFKQQFFNRTLISKKDFSAVSYKSEVSKEEDSLGYIARMDATFDLPYTPSDHFSFPMRMYFGPNDYYILKSYHLGLENVVPLGYGIYTFAKYINKWLFLPLFVFLGKLFGGHWGIVIIFMTIVIRLLISPLTYKSYLSQAKMKALKPELDELKKKYKGDQQKFGMAQMNLYRQVGVSPLGGCLPMLLQLPIFAGLYCLFQSAIQVRHQSFLWINDLSRYDSILHLPFHIPLYGDHVSLLTILMTVTSLFMTLYNTNMTSMSAGQDNPMMKYMPYMMPIFFLGFFNSMAAALTLYYFISNLITLIIQLVIQKFIIDDEKIHAELQAKKKQKPQKSKLMQRMEDIQKQQQAATRQRNQR